MPDLTRPKEAEAFLDARQHTAPEVVSACEGWTAHEVTAHLAAAAAEITRHLGPTCRAMLCRGPAASRSVNRSGAMDDATLCRALDEEEAKLRELIHQVLIKEPQAVVDWTGRQMSVRDFLPHMRNEFAITGGTS